jgi:hypothetical protein
VRFALAIAALGIACALFGERVAHGQERQKAPAPTELAIPVEPPPITVAYLEYGVAFTAQFATSGAFCKDSVDCVLGSGGGIAIRVGYRAASPWYFGGTFEFSKQDSTKLYRLAILKQLRAEARYYIDTGREAQPFLSAGAGVAAYGDQIDFATWGPAGFLATGLEVQLDRRILAGFILSYRPIYLQAFQVTAGDVNRGPGVAHMIVLELSLEVRDPL